MKIAVLSGKGGTGKTLVATNLSFSINNSLYLDCDVEEPNGHLFFESPLISSVDVSLPIPRVIDEKCDGCMKCVDFCKFNALAYVGNKVLVFDKICHSCGGCKLVCPQDAIYEEERVIGKIESRKYGGVDVHTGILNPGEESGTKIISRLMEIAKSKREEITVIDSPPGSSCVVMDSIKDADYCIIVAESSIFGAHNLEMVHELVLLFEKPMGVVLNKTTNGINPSKLYCENNNIPILLDIPFSKKINAISSSGVLISEEDEKYKIMFTNLLKKITGGEIS